MPIFTVIQGPDKGRQFEVADHEPQLIGRSSEAIPLSDNAISRRHAELTPDDGVWYIRDLQSQNGTYVNGSRITDRTRLIPGDQIRTGQTLMVFGATETSAPDAVRIVGKRHVDASVERTIPSSGLFGGGNEDSMILAEPEPRAADHLRIIYRLTTLLSSRVMGGDEMLKGVLDLVFAEFHPERGCIMLGASPSKEGAAKEGSQEHQLSAVAVKYRQAPVNQDQAKILVSRTILQHVMNKGEGVLSTNAMTDPRFAKGDSVQQFNIRSAICSPVKFREHTFGAIYVDSSMVNYTFTSAQLALLNAIGQHAGLALNNAELYQQRLQTQRLAAIGETVATLSHAIKNILQGLRGGADVVEMGLKKDDLRLARGGWGILQRNLDRIIGLTMNMLAFSRQRRIELELMRVGPLLEECAQLAEPVASAKKVAVIVDIDPDVPPVALDSSLLHQAVMNLLTNAIEAVAPETGAVTLRCNYRALPKVIKPRVPGEKPQRPMVEVEVTDNGPGIPISKQAWIFEPFNTTKGAKGTGLGLAVAKRVAEEHGGKLTLESGEGAGAKFKLLLPADLTPADDPSATAASRQSLGSSLSGGGGLSGESVKPGM